MTTIHPVHVYYDANGNVTEWAVSDDDGYSPSERPGMVRASISRATYDALPPAYNFAGLAVEHDLNKACLAALLQADPARGAKLQVNIATADAQLQAADAQAALIAPGQAASIAAWNALTPQQQQAIITAEETPIVVVVGGP